MKNKIVKQGIEARNKLVKGADFLAEGVRSTLGPYGQNWFIEKGNKITNDGVTIAREIECADEIEDRGAKALFEAADRTNNEVGDGTTTAITLAHAILKESIKNLASNVSIVGKLTGAELIKQLEKERVIVTEKLLEAATSIETEEQLIASAKVSVENDTLAELIGKTQFKLGRDGIIIAEESNAPESSIEFVNGIRLDNGFGTSLVVTDPEKEALIVKDTRTILTNHTIQSLNTLNPILAQLAKQGVRRVVIVSRGFTEQAIKECMENMKNGFNIYPVNAPYTDQSEIMKDLATVLGGRYINSEEADLESIQLSDVGFAEVFEARRWDAIVTGAKDENAKERVEKRVIELKKKLEGNLSQFEQRMINQRIAQLSTGFAVLKVGAQSDKERKYLKDKADDAVNAVRLAFQEGTIKGAGLTLKEISDSLPEDFILKRPLCSIYEQITFSAPKGFVIEDWVRDPVKVVRVALKYACSVAGTIATAGGVTATEKEKPMWVQQAKQSTNDEV